MKETVFRDTLNKRFTAIEVLRPIRTENDSSLFDVWWCKCSCGNFFVAIYSSLLSANDGEVKCSNCIEINKCSYHSIDKS